MISHDDMCTCPGSFSDTSIFQLTPSISCAMSDICDACICCEDDAVLLDEVDSLNPILRRGK